ncbi:hypothetical protein DMB42_20040 [Nonomuraea sp. WAC 01424]|nr:hypothetical protein DMB42_20040 [Nonomuraea sp. WAC 01424]
MTTRHNATAESFFSALKNECLHRFDFTTRTKPRRQAIRYIEGFYNPRRLHTPAISTADVDVDRHITMPNVTILSKAPMPTKRLNFEDALGKNMQPRDDKMCDESACTIPTSISETTSGSRQQRCTGLPWHAWCPPGISRRTQP